ncbi:MAG: DEAD/DEAH box helicase family protein [Spirochaetaceae bacterium]|nr:DEAD/DEAH box helicase family protein [Spirochaetaceae bacterium]
MERKTISDIHFSIHSVIVDEKLKEKFFRWVAGDIFYNVIDWLSSPISKTEIPEEISWNDIIDYSEGIPFINRSLSGTEGDMLKILRMETAERLFDKFLHEGLDEETKLKVENMWNERFNSFSSVDYENFDYTLEGFSGTFDGKKFVFHEQQKKGIAFLCTKRNGLLAYDVGVGKTATGIAAIVYQMQRHICRRPLIVVPKAVYSKWIHDTSELFPDIKINKLENLNKEIIDELRMNAVFSDSKDNYLLPKNTISICTAEALEKIYYDEMFIQRSLSITIGNMISQKHLENELIAPPDLSLEEYVLFDSLGVDLVLVDEAHRYKNLIRKASGSNTEFSNLGFGTSSSRSVKMLAMTDYIHYNNYGKNVFLLTATPFTNSPMEIYSMLLFVAGKELRKMGYKTINDFLNEFAEIKIEWTVNNKNNVVQKTVMKSFRSLYALQQIIQNYIDKVDAEEANIKRPEKETHVLKIEMNDLQKQICYREIERLIFTKSLGDVFKGMNNLRMNMISPVLIKEKYPPMFGIKIPALSKMVDCSPKLMLVCNTVLFVYKAKPECGQIIYLPRGVKESTSVKQYLVKKGIPSKAIALMNSGTTELQKQKITTAFNDPVAPLKVLIGSETISEGVDLNGNTLVLYNCMLGWNPTEPVQVEGRLWRQGNRQKKVHIVYPLMYNSIDSLIYQKHDEKVSRIDAIWSYRGDRLNVEDINPTELKFDLIKSADKKAEIMLEEELVPLKKQIRIIDESFELITTAEAQKALLEEEIDSLEKQAEELHKYRKKVISDGEKLPESIRTLNDIIIGNVDSEIQDNKMELTIKRRNLTLISNKLQKKLEFTLGENFTSEQKTSYFEQLQSQKSEIKSQIKKVRGKKDALIRMLQAQYDAEQKAELHSVPKLTEELVSKILEN